MAAQPASAVAPAAPGDSFPPPSALSRSVLVRNVPVSASSSTIDEFFSFCGDIAEQRMAPSGDRKSLDAIVVFTDDSSRRTALLMDASSILDATVSIGPVPDGFALGSAAAPPPAAAAGMFGGIFAALTGEMEKAGAMFDQATESGVLKTARESVVEAGQQAGAFVKGIDAEYQVTEKTTAFAGVATEKTKGVLGEIDEKLHVGEVVQGLRNKAMENPAVSSGVEGIRSGIDSLLSQTGLVNGGQVALPAAGQTVHSTAAAPATASSSVPAADPPTVTS